MQNKALIVVAVVLGIIALGLVTAVVYNKYASGQEPEGDAVAVAVVDTTPVTPKYPEMRAKQSIPRGTRITAEMVEIFQVDTPAQGVMTDPAKLSDHYANTTINSGSPIIESKLHRGKWRFLVARSTLAAGSRVEELHINVQELDEYPTAVSGLLEDSDEDRTKVNGRICREQIPAGAYLTENAFYARKAIQLSYLIPVYKRAITVQIKGTDLANNYLVKPGDAVDVIARFEQNFAGVDVTRTIVQNAEVLALDRTIDKAMVGDSVVFQFVTLAVTPRESEKLAFANKHATEIRLVLRSPLQRGQRETENAIRGSLLGENFGPPRNIEVFSGGQRQAPQTIQEY